VITRIINLDPTSNVSFQVNRGALGATPIISMHTLDARARRLTFSKVGNKITGALSNDPAAPTLRAISAGNGSTNISVVPVIIVPNSHLLVECMTLNAAMEIQFEGYERAATAEELSAD